MTEHSNLMTHAGTVHTFALAGNARLTLVSKATKARYSYRVKASEDGKVHFVSVLTGSDNEGDYTYLGIIGNDGTFRRTRQEQDRRGRAQLQGLRLVLGPDPGRQAAPHAGGVARRALRAL